MFVWSGWTTAVYPKRTVCLQRGQVIQRKEEAAKQAAWAEAGSIIADLKLSVASLQQQVRQEQAGKAQLEEDMKQAFMRGVCALNLEVCFWRFLPTSC